MMYKPEEECSKLAKNIKIICEAKGLSTYAAAEKACMSKSTLNDLLNGKNRPQLYTLYKICNALDISILELFGMNEKESLSAETGGHREETEDEKKFIVTYRYLPAWKKKCAEQYMRMLAEYGGSD